MADGEEEPDDWMVESVNHTLEEGHVGILHFAEDALVDWAFIGVGVGGEEAPRPPADILD